MERSVNAKPEWRLGMLKIGRSKYLAPRSIGHLSVAVEGEDVGWLKLNDEVKK